MVVDSLCFVQVIFGGRWRHLVGEPELWERVGGVDIAFTPASFGQANTQVFVSHTLFSAVLRSWFVSLFAE